MPRPSTNDGFRLSGGRATLVDAYASGNRTDGFDLGSAQNRCIRCYAFGSNSGYGFRIRGDRNTVVKSSSISNDGDGFRISGDRPVLKDNIVVGNGLFGINLYNVESPIVVKNQLFGNGSGGIDSYDAVGGRFVANVAADNGGIGIAASGVASARNNVFVANHAIANQDHGVRCDGNGTGYVFASNRAIANSNHGIVAYQCSGRILRSTAFGNAQGNAVLHDLSNASMGCSSMSFYRNFLGTVEVPASGVTVNDPCID